jgi:hypothetical protein
MTNEELHKYRRQLSLKLQPLDRYVERRFTAASETGGLSVDMDLHFRGIFRDREPKLNDLLKQARVLILAEPGGGKSVVARAAVHQFLRGQERVPIFAELKEYRSDLAALLAKAVPPAILDPAASVDGKPLSRAYVLDGIDEIPRGLLPELGVDLQKLFERDSNASALLTARQAFYVAHSNSLPAITSIFHILDFSDKDVAEYLRISSVDTKPFLAAVQAADADEEIRNPFILSVMIERYREAGALSDRRSENLSYMIDRLIQSRPQVNQHQQRRALRMLGVALETYSRNELTEEEALRVIKQAMQISDAEAHRLLDELYASILKRTANGLAFQMRSYGEYLAAEALEDEPLDRIRELAFLDYNTPNETWLNTVSYLIELNSLVRKYFVRQHPLWTISASPAVFSEEEKTSIVTSALQSCAREKQYIPHHPLINVRRLSRFVTGSMEKSLIANLANQDDLVRGNALVILGIMGRPEIIPKALGIVKDRSLADGIRFCAVLALVNAGNPRHVPELLAMLDPKDPLHINLLDMIGALIDESQIHTVLPLILRENAMLSSTYYHFREFKSRDALIQTLRYFPEHASALNTIRAEGYIEPIMELLPRFFDAEIAKLCADIIGTIEAQQIYPDRSGPMSKLFELMHEADREGRISRIFFERALDRGNEQSRRIYYVDEILASLMKPQTAQWLIDIGATRLIQELAPYCRGNIREILRPHSGGVIDVQDAKAKAYRDEESRQEESRTRHIKIVQARLLSRTSLNEALEDLWELKEDYWPELPETYRNWLASEVSKQLNTLDLENTIRWEGSTLWQPRVLAFLLKLIDRYALRIAPDEPLVFVLIGLDTSTVAKYHERFGLSGAALRTLERLLITPASPQALEGVVRFVESSEVWSPEIEAGLTSIASSPTDQGYIQITALSLLVKHGVDSSFIEIIARSGANQDLRKHAFDVLIEQQHRPTIERALARLADNELKAGNVNIPDMSPLSWLVKIKSDFGWDKLVTLRARALQLELPMLVGLVTDALAKIDRARAAIMIRQQVDLAPENWRAAQVAQAIEQERTARIEAARQTPFDDVLRKLKGSTSINRLKVLCEGPTDRPVFRSLLDQIGSLPDIIFDSVNGWGNLHAESDPNIWLLGCKEAFIVMDGDEGRHLRKRGKPYTKPARQERKKLAGLPIDFRVLERYGIENYFPQHALEKVIGTDLSAYFPIPDDVSVLEHLSKSRASWRYRLKRLVAKRLRLAPPSPKEPLYSKHRNADSVRYMNLQDLQRTDLFNIVHDISQTAKRMVDE